MRIDGHQRHLRHWSRLDIGLRLRILARAHFSLVGSPFLHLLVHQPHAGVHRLGCGTLKVRIECGVDAISMIVQLAFAELVRKLVLYQVHEVRSVAGFHVECTFRSTFLRHARFAPDGRTVVYDSTTDGKPTELFSTRTDTAEA